MKNLITYLSVNRFITSCDLSIFLHIKSILILLILLIYCSISALAQISKIDSLSTVLQYDISDSARASTLIELSRLGRFTRQDSTLIWSEMAKEIAINIDDKQLEGLAIYTASYTYELQAKYKLAMEKCFEALKIFDEINYSKGIGRVYNYIAIIHFRQKQYIQALEFYQKSLEAKLLDPDTISIGWTYNNIGATYEHLEDYEQALKNYNLALDIAKTFNSRILNAASYGNIGIIYQKTGLLNESLESHLQSLKVFQEIDNKQYIAEAYQHIASIYLEQNKLNESEQYLINGLELSQEINDRHRQAKFYETLIQLNEQNSDYLKALSYYKLLIVVKDSLFNINSSNQMAELETKYQSEQNQKENELLKKSLESKNIILLSTTIVIALLILLSFLLYRFYLTKKRTSDRLTLLNQQVVQQKEELKEQSEKLIEANKKISNQKDSYRADYESVKMLDEIGAKITSTLSIETIIERVYENVNKLMSANSFAFGLYNKVKNTLDFHGGIEMGEKLDDFNYNLNDSSRIAVKCFKDKRVILTNDLNKDYPKYPKPKIGKQPHSMLYVPLVLKSKAIGVLSVQSFNKNAYSDFHIYILNNLAVFISIATENAQTFDQLEKSYGQLQELDEYKEAMTAMIVHDFKNSLNTVISFSEGTPTERRLKSIRHAGQFMLNMVLNILDVQKFETTEIKLAPSNNYIGKVIDEAVNQLSYMLEQKSIKLKYHPKQLMANYDYELTTRVITNILSNAIKYVPVNGNIEIITEQMDGMIKTSIRDNGLGIPSDKIEMVFDKYSQINAKASGGVRSTGIGLAFCKMVVEAQSGAIGVTSEEGKGSNFYFTLPLPKITKEPKPTLEKVNIDLKKEKSLVLTQKEKGVLIPIIEELKQWEVYDYSEVTAILEKVNEDSANINSWKEQMINALQNVNDAMYEKLINDV